MGKRLDFLTEHLSRTFLAASLVFGFGVIPASAEAADLDCGELAETIRTGDRYQFNLDKENQIVRIVKGNDSCMESADAWYQRMLILPPPPRENKSLRNNALKETNDMTPLPGQTMREGALPNLGIGDDSDGTAPIPTVRVTSPPPGETPTEPDPEIESSPTAPTEETAQSAADAQLSVSDQADPSASVQEGAGSFGSTETGTDVSSDIKGVIAGRYAPPDPDGLNPCDRKIQDYWQPGSHIIDNTEFWLSGVFTMDLNSDGRTDDVGFKIRAEKKVGNVLRYFPTQEGRYAGQTIPTLKLKFDDDIWRLCLGNVTFPKPENIAKQETAAVQKMASEKMQPSGNAESPDKETPVDKTEEEKSGGKDLLEALGMDEETFTLMVTGIAIGVILLMFAAIGLGLLIRKRMKD